MKRRVSILVTFVGLITVLAYVSGEEPCIGPPHDRNCNGIPDKYEKKADKEQIIELLQFKA